MASSLNNHQLVRKKDKVVRELGQTALICWSGMWAQHLAGLL